MDVNETAKKLAKLRREEARFCRRMSSRLSRVSEDMAKLAELQAEQCELLRCVVPEAGLEPEVAALVVAPKDDGGED